MKDKALTERNRVMKDKRILFEHLTPDMLEGVAGGVITPECEKGLRMDIAAAKSDGFSMEETIGFIMNNSDMDMLSRLGTTPEELADYARAHWDEL